MDEVGGVALAQPGSQRTGPRQRAGDRPLPLLPLRRELLELGRGVRVGAGRADEDAVERRDPLR